MCGTEGCSDPPWNNEVAAIIVEVLEDVRPILMHGIPDLGIPPLDPLGPLGHIVFHVDTSALRYGTDHQWSVCYSSIAPGTLPWPPLYLSVASIIWYRQLFLSTGWTGL